METFVFIILATLAAVVLFWLLAIPAALLFGVVCSILNGIRAGLKPTPTRH